MAIGIENIYPREIEEFLHTCPAIADVQVIGIPDAIYGEEVMAWVKLKRGATLGEQDMKNFCKGRIANFKIPRYVRFVASFPMTGSGKIQNFRMREISLAEFSTEEATALAAV
jgi:fatty-acyl-CoA synthase